MTRRRKTAAFALVATLSLAALARAQDHEQGPNPDDVKKKILEIERLMKGAEESLARSTDTRNAAERAAEAARKLLDDKSKAETGKTSEQLRKEAEAGSAEAKETLERLTKAANEEAQEAAKKIAEVLDGKQGGGAAGGAGSAGGAGKGIREIIERVKGEGQGASQGIQWLLDQASKQQKSQSPPKSGQDKQKQPNAADPKKDKTKPEDKPKDQNQKPESKTEPPRSPEFEQWIAELPAQVRKAYETQDWDSIPPKWRDMLREWTKKMADDLEKEKDRR